MSAATSSRPALRGDEETLYSTHHTRLLQLVAIDVSARPQVIEDACGFAWAELIARQPERTSIVGWLRVVARREAVRLARHDRVTVSLSGLRADDPAPRAARDTSPPDAPYAHCEVLEALAAVAALPERQRTFLSLKVAGCSYDEIAQHLGVTWRTVDRRLVRARAALRAESAIR
jgi:RNA polymerase sigma factor (sigma-70 family)